MTRDGLLMLPDALKIAPHADASTNVNASALIVELVITNALIVERIVERDVFALIVERNALIVEREMNALIVEMNENAWIVELSVSGELLATQTIATTAEKTPTMTSTTPLDDSRTPGGCAGPARRSLTELGHPDRKPCCRNPAACVAPPFLPEKICLRILTPSTADPLWG
jgi:hypothetical protein